MIRVPSGSRVFGRSQGSWWALPVVINNYISKHSLEGSGPGGIRVPSESRVFRSIVLVFCFLV